MSGGNKNAWQTAANQRWQANLRATLERCQRYGGAYEAEHLAEAFDCNPKAIHEWAKRWGLEDVLRNGIPTLEEARRIVVPGRTQDPSGRAFKAERLWGVKTGGES